MNTIRSVQNPLIKYIQKLKKKKYREQEKKFLIEGLRFVEEALMVNWPVESILFFPDIMENPRVRRILEMSRKQKVKTVPVEKNILEPLFSTEAPQGLLAICNTKKWQLEKALGQGNGSKQEALVVLVDRVSDPGNLGTIIRSADAFGVNGVLLLKGCVDLYNDKTLRSTMGSIFHLPLVDQLSLEELSSPIDAGDFQLLVGVPQGGVPVDRINANRRLALVVGSEAEGPSEGILSLPHQKVTIPMPGGAESLNVAVAASILLYQIVLLRNQRVDNF